MPDSWQAIRSLDGHDYMPAVMRYRGWRRFLINFSIVAAALFLGLMSWLIAKPTATRLHETVPGERMTFAATPDIDISLDADSTVTITNTEPPRVELLRGNAYFDVKGNNAGKLQVKVGTTYIRDIGTRFSVSKRMDGGSVAVASGQVEIQVETGKYLIGAHERADFNNTNVTGQKVIAEADVAPWHPRR
ncbi:MAG: FecR family protein [Nitrosospira sp.]